MTLDHPCKKCGAQIGERCLDSKGKPRGVTHDVRRPAKEKKPRVTRATFAMQLRMANHRTRKAEEELRLVKDALREETAENKRLRRLLHSTNVLDVMTLQKRLKEAEARIRYLTAEILD